MLVFMYTWRGFAHFVRFWATLSSYQLNVFARQYVQMSKASL